MRTRTRFLTLALVAAFAIAGCGEDNNDNDDVDPVPTSTAPVRTSTPGGAPTPTNVVATPTTVAATATATTIVGPTATATTVVGPTATATGVPAPSPTSTAGSGVACNGEGAALNVTITTLPGSDLDTGWTGISHNTVATHSNTVTTALNCTGNACDVDGTALVNTAFGSPLPLSSGGISVCVLNTFREAVTGTYDCVSGCSQSSVKILSSIFLVNEASKPCPPCVGDPTPNDGVKGGTCEGGTTAGAACDVGGISDLFQLAGGATPDSGKTSNDCRPTGSSVGELDIDLNPLTTGTVTVPASVDCLSADFPPGSCYCPGQVQANACVPDKVCGATGRCEQNPPIGRCAGQTFRSCRPTQGNRDCETTFPGAGACVAEQPACFGSTIERQGVCGTQTGTLAAVFCIGETRAQAINTTAGLPGPGAVTIPGSQVRTPR